MKSLYPYLVFSFLTLFIISMPVHAQTEQVESNLNISSLPAGVSTYQLDNGLEILLIENRGLPMVGVNVVVKTGSAYETFSTSGMSHMLEHLLFNGTETRTQKELYDTVDLIGGYNNANTGNYFTNYMMVTPKEHIRKGMKIQADMLFHSVLPVDKFEKEKGIVLEEIARSLENESSQLERNMRAVLYEGHALSLPTLGTYATIESMNRDEVYAYYKNNYVPNNMIMSVVGNFETDSMLTMINDIYGKEQPKQILYPRNPGWSMGFDIPDETRDHAGKVYQRSYGGEKQILQLYYPLPSNWSVTHFSIVDEILDKAKSDLTDTLKKTYPNIERSFDLVTMQSPYKNFLKISVTLREIKKLKEIADAINVEIKKLKFQLQPESIKYLATAKKTTFLKNVEKPHMFGIYNAGIFAEGGIEAVIASYSTSNYLPAGDDLSTYFIWEDPVIILQTPGITSDENGQAYVNPAQLFVDKLSGLTTIAQENPNSDLLAIHILLKYKAQFESQTGKDAAMILHDCLGQRLNSVENQKISNQFGLTYKVNDNPFIPMDNIYLDPDFSYIRVEGLAEDVKGVINYIKEQLTRFQATEDEYQQAMAKSKQPMMGMGSNKAGEIFTKTYKSYLNEPDKYEKNTQPVSFKDMNNMAVYYFHPSNMIISVVSPLSADSIHSLLQWDVEPLEPNPNIDKNPMTSSLKVQIKPVVEEIKMGGERSFLFWGFVSEIDQNDKPALKALDLLLSDRIIFDVREKQGRAYRMRAGVDQVGNKALFYINLGTRPANIDPLLDQVAAFFDQKVIESFTETDLNKSISMYIGRMMFRRLSSINRAYYLGHSQYFHNDINYDANFHAALKNITLDDVKLIAEKYMIVKNPVTVVVR